MVDISARSYVRSRLTAGMTAGVALGAASAIALTPLVVPDASSPDSVRIPHVSTSSIDLTAVVTSSDIAALVNNLNTAMSGVSSAVTSLAGAPGQTLAGALNSAVALNNTWWDQLIDATDNPALRNVLTALRDLSNGGLSELAATTGSANDTVTLSTGQVASLLTSTLTGSVATAQHAVATVFSNPLAAASYTGLLDVPLNIAGLGLNAGLAAARDLGVNGLGLGNAVVHGVTAQITNIVSAVNDLASRGVTGAPLIDRVLNAVQAIALLPVTVGVAGANGLTDTVTEAGSIAWTRITNGAAAAVTTWLGNGTDAGAVQNAINKIWAGGQLSPAAYADAASVLVGAAINTGKIAVGTAGSMASLPFSIGADLTTTGADMIKTFNTHVATAAAALGQAVGLPPYVSNLPHVLAGAVNGAITIAAVATSATLNGIASAIDIGNTLTGAMPTQRLLALSVPSDSPALTADSVSTETTSDAETESVAEIDTHASTESEAAETNTTETNNTDPAVDTETTGATAEKVTPLDETGRNLAAEEAPGFTKSTDITSGAEEPEGSTTYKNTTTTTDDLATTRDASTDDSKKADKPTAASAVNRPESESESESDDDSEKKDEANKPDDNSSNRATAGGRHSPDTVKNGTTVNEIKSRLDKETSGNPGVAAAGESDAAA